MNNEELARELDERIERLIALVAATRKWDPLLHPRGKDGKFIEKGGWVKGILNFIDKATGKPSAGKTAERAEVTDIRPNPADANNPILDVRTSDGRVATVIAGDVDVAPSPKASLSMSEPSEPADDALRKRVHSNAVVEDESLFPAVEPNPRGTADEIRAFINDFIGRNDGLNAEDADVRASQLDNMYADIGFGTQLDTDFIYNKQGPAKDVWSEERQAQHEEMWQDLISQVEAVGVPKDKDALALGGLPGAGKSFSLKPGEAAEEFGVVAWEPDGSAPPDGTTHVSINPDIIKELLIKRGMLPEGVADELKPMEQVNFIHEESSYLAKLFLARLSYDGYNVILDNTMESPDGMLKRMKPLAKEGYKFRGLFADISVSESRSSARQRYARSFQTELGGRFVPSGVQRDEPSQNGRMSVNRDTFDLLAGVDRDGNSTGTGWFTDFVIVDNSGISGDPPRPAKTITLRGKGDGAPAQEMYTEAGGEAVGTAPAVVSAAEGDVAMVMTDDEFAKALFKGEITPEEGLEKLRANQVQVYPDPTGGKNKADASWGEVEDFGAGASSIQQALFVAGGRHLAEDYSTEVARLRAEGHTLTF